jgi:hypothetical protein
MKRLLSPERACSTDMGDDLSVNLNGIGIRFRFSLGG